MEHSSKKEKRVALFGAAPDTSNMGVTALYMSTITGLSKYIDNLEFVVFDNGLGLREDVININNDKTVKIIRYGARSGLRYYRPENTLTMLVMSNLGKLGAILNTGVKLIDSCDVVLDVSGGDSFSDIYGMVRFNSINRPKQITINRKKPLFLLPQTYGPYKKLSVRQQAGQSVKNASIAWARDKDSYKILQDLLGSDFSSKRHQCGVDMAFGLPTINAEKKVSKLLKDWLNKSSSSEDILVGINVSGLIYNDPKKTKKTYGFKADYKKLVNDFISWILNNTKAKVVLVSHVMTKPGHYESDFEACEEVAATVDEKFSSRIIVSPQTLNESEVKWLISKLNWFCGTRMHSTIAGLSSCVPTSAISYSDKTKGVFDTCEQGKHVIDPRINDTDEAVQLLINSYKVMNETKRSMSPHIQKVINSADKMMQEIANKI